MKTTVWVLGILLVMETAYAFLRSPARFQQFSSEGGRLILLDTARGRFCRPGNIDPAKLRESDNAELRTLANLPECSVW